MRTIVVVVAVLLLLVQVVVCGPFWRVGCSGRPIFRGRLDSIVSPGAVSGHVHKVHGGSNFGPALANQTSEQVYDEMLSSPCTTCALRTVDNSAYWHPDLFYEWPNGTYSLVPTGGLLIYYLHRSGSGAQANPAWKAFPRGFRMISGNPFRRSFNASKVADRAINFACLDYDAPASPETNHLPTGTKFCKSGLRLQVHFPQCWDGKNLDSPSHTTHVAFPENPDGGNCPSTHPVRLTDLFFEAHYSVDKFPHGTGRQPFVLACGDSTGYGFHGDFLNGWDVNVLQSAIDDPSCDISNTNGVVERCNTLAPFVQSTAEGACTLSKDINLNENIGFVASTNLPGCNPVTGQGPNAVPCFEAPAAGLQAPVTHATQRARFLLKSVETGRYVRPLANGQLRANSTKTTYWETYTTIPLAGGFVAIMNEISMKFWTTGDTIIADKGEGQIQGWEQFKIVPQPNNRFAFISNRNNYYLTVNADFSISAKALPTPAPTARPATVRPPTPRPATATPTASPTVLPTLGNAQLFEFVVPTGGGI